MKIVSDYANLDVKGGRAALSQHFEQRPNLGPCPDELRIPVTITGYIDNVFGHDDGTSQQFIVIVDKVEVTS